MSFNRTPASQDAQFAKHARNPELATLIDAVFGTSFAASGRTDLEKIFIPEVLRVVTTTDPVRLSGSAARALGLSLHAANPCVTY